VGIIGGSLAPQRVGGPGHPEIVDQVGRP
jgi:hypothetical protein